MPQRLPYVLICDDDHSFHPGLKSILKGSFECRSVYNSDEALAVVRNQSIDLLVLDICMRTPDEGLKAIPIFKELDPDMAIVVSSGITDFKTVREAMKLGAADYLEKGCEPDSIIITLNQALEKRSILLRSNQQNFEAASIQRKSLLIGDSPAMISLKKMIERIRQSPANVLITGETGTGKEVVARQLRQSLSDGSLAPFVAIDSSTIQASMAESILFGHEKGAFTGADRTTKGVFEQADGGMIYFDEIANMPLDIQAKLLRVIQEREVSRLGSNKVMPLNFRVVCATNKDLEQMAQTGLFKDDLLQRLNVLPIHLPPLRDRKEDISLLVQYFLNQQSSSAEPLKFTAETLEALKAYHWPGNIRELANVIAYVTTMNEGTEVEVSDLPPKIRDSNLRSGSPTQAENSTETGLSFYDRVSTFEKELLQREYEKHEGNISKIALSLGMDRSHLYAKLKDAGIHASRKR
jgi:DNA-binding NtrC family response regulator